MVRAGSGFLDTGLIFHYNDGSKPGGWIPVIGWEPAGDKE